MSESPHANFSGSDSSGGAGIEADIKTITVHSCYAMTCITGLTAQNTTGVSQIHTVNDQSFINAAFDAVFSDVGVDAVKTGMLSTKETVLTVAAKLKQEKPQFIVVDPVMVSTSGAHLIPSDAIAAYVSELMPLATVITPNIGEAEEILAHLGMSTKLESLKDVEAAAIALQERLNCSAVLVKGGHLGLDSSLVKSAHPTTIVDVLYNGTDITTFKSDFIDSKSTHGTGCTLSSALASNLAQGQPLADASRNAIHYVQHAIATAFALGHGHGPVNHTFNISARSFTPGKFVDYLLAHPKVAPHWQKYTTHPFTVQLGATTLPRSVFSYYLRQDYIYLKHYARCHALAAYKSTDMETIADASTVISTIAHEQKMQLAYCAQFGVTPGDLENEPEGIVTRAYSRYILDIGAQADWLSLQVALAPCLLGYGPAALHALALPTTIHGADQNPYWKWLEEYSGPVFAQAAEKGRKMLEKHALGVSEEKVAELVDVFAEATKLECEFWDQALNYKGE